MNAAPRMVMVYRRTELAELLARHATRGQAAFFLSNRGRSIDEVSDRAALQAAAVSCVLAAVPLDWRRGQVERSDLPRFLFEPRDIIVVVGQDGLVANVAKYLGSQPVIGINPDPTRNPGVLVPHAAEDAGRLMAACAGGEPRVKALTMVRADSDDGQSLTGLNELFIGPPTHQTARYAVHAGEATEHQASSGLIVATGTGATGWCRSIWLERQSRLALPAPTDPRLAWFVREPWPSPATGTSLCEGDLSNGDRLAVTAESDGLVIFGDGLESDHLTLGWGQTATLRVADTHLMMVS